MMWRARFHVARYDILMWHFLMWHFLIWHILILIWQAHVSRLAGPNMVHPS